MTTPIPFVFEDNLVRAVERCGVPWFVGKDVCHVLGIAKHHQALDRLDEDERGTYNVGTPQGEQMMIIISEPGVFRLIFTSRKPEAERFKRWLAHVVLPKLRRDGFFGTPPEPRLEDQAGNPFNITGEASKVQEIKLAIVREARHLWGHERARACWQAIGLPLPPEPRVGGQSEARDCLWTLLNSQHHGVRLLSLLEQAMNEEAGANDALRRLGLHAEPDDDGYIVANVSKVLDGVYEGTKWHNGHWKHALRRLPGARLAPRRTYAIGHNARGTFLPAKTLDVLAEPEQAENEKASREA